jgi:anti-sigma factor ChrR (cupin superfamily)
MGATAAVHPTDQVLQSYGLGKLDDASSVSVSKHLEGCNSCQRRVAELSSDEFLGRLRNAQVQSDKSGTSWSPSAASSNEGNPGRVAQPPSDTLPPGLADHPRAGVRAGVGGGSWRKMDSAAVREGERPPHWPSPTRGEGIITCYDLIYLC